VALKLAEDRKDRSVAETRPARGPPLGRKVSSEGRMRIPLVLYLRPIKEDPRIPNPWRPHIFSKKKKGGLPGI